MRREFLFSFLPIPRPYLESLKRIKRWNRANKNSRQIFELMTGGGYLFGPASGSRYSKDDYIAQIIELMGEIPKTIAFAGKV